MARPNIKNNGFTLIETIIYSVLISIIIGYSLGGVYTLIQDSTRLNDRAIIDEEANFLLKKIGWALSSMQTIVLPASGATGPSLNVNRYNFPSNPVVFSLDSGNLRVSYDGGTPVILNNDRSVISNLSFHHIAPTLLRPDGLISTLSVNGRVYTMTLYQNK